MKSEARPQRTGSRPTAAEDAFSDEWFVRYLLSAVLLVVLVLTAIGIALYVDPGEYFRDGSKEPGAGFLACMVVCPALGVVTLGLALYAGVRLFLRPRTWGHAFVRLALLVAHVSVLLVWADTISSTATALVGGLGQSSNSTVAWSAIEGRDFSGPPSDGSEGAPEGLPSSPPFGLSAPGLAIPGGGTSSR